MVIGKWIAVSALVLALAACGGGGGGGAVRNSPPPSSPPPTSPPPVSPNPYRAPERTGDAARPYINDHLFWTQTDAAHANGITGSGVVVGVVDSGVNHDHPALQGRVTNLTYVPSPPNNLTVDDVVGHGTAVAQVIAGKAFGQWPGGIAPDAGIVSARIIWDKSPEDDGSGEGNPVDTAEQPMGLGLQPVHDDLIAHGAKIMNNSWGGLYWRNPQSTTLIAQEYSRFVNENGGLVVFATGNEGRSNPHDMAALPSQQGPNGVLTAAYLEKGWLAVTALDVVDHNLLASYANACGIAMHYCLAASGSVAVTGTNDTPGNPTYWSWTGTSLAAPQVSGAAALVWQQFPYLTNGQIRQVLLGTADDLGVLGVDPVFGYGRLNVARALKGPARFDWGDFIADFDGVTSTWSNSISGDGGLIKRGNGTLELTAPQYSYAGGTRVEAGTLRVSGSHLYSGAPAGKTSINIADGALLAGYASLNANVQNSGTILPDYESVTMDINGNYHQTASGHLGVMLGGTWLEIHGNAIIDGGTVRVMGTAPTRYYGAPMEQTVMRVIQGSLTGAFSGVDAAPGLFVDATLRYSDDSNSVYPAYSVHLNVTRLDVAVAAASLPHATLADITSAKRVEAAFKTVDSQLGGSGGVISDGFLDNAGRFQSAGSTQQALASLRSLSGESHAVADAAGLDNLEANRRVLSARFGELAGQSTPRGNWYRPLGQPGQGGSALGQFQNDGWLMGSDQQLGANTVAGFAFGETDTDGFLGYDRSRERQTQARFYVGTVRGRAYALGQFGAGRYERQLRRTLLLGDRADRVATDYAGNFTTANLEAGYRFGGADKSWVPYAGVDYARLDRDGFIENGAAGFGLKTHDSIAERTLAVAGLRAERAWTTGSGMGWTLRGYAEWQRTLSENGLLAQASFVGADSWSPLYGEGFSRSAGLLGLGIDAALSRHAMLSLGYDQRFGSLFDDRQWSAKLRYGF